jgi:TRAP-type mannitol/chloroaromatic compound transport system permease small subunit
VPGLPVRRSPDSNAAPEIQRYLFAGVFMLGAGYVMLRNGHVRIDFVSARFSRRTNAVIDLLGLVLVLVVVPRCALMIYLSRPLFERAYRSGETSRNAGGLIRWPVLLLMPLGFLLLAAQASAPDSSPAIARIRSTPSRRTRRNCCSTR